MFQIFMMSACQSFPDYPPAAPLAAPSGSSTSTSSTMYTSTHVPTCSASIAGNATSATVFPGAAAISTISGPCQTAPPMIASPPRAPGVVTAGVASGRGTQVISPIGATPRPATTTTLTIPQPAIRMPQPVRNSSFNFLDSINPMREHTIKLCASMPGANSHRGVFTVYVARQFRLANGRDTIQMQVERAKTNMCVSALGKYMNVQKPLVMDTLSKILILPPAKSNQQQYRSTM